MGIIDFIRWFWSTFGVLATLFFVDLSLWPVARFILPKIKSRTLAAIFHIVTGVGFCALLFAKQLWITFLMVILTYIGLHFNTTVSIIIDVLCNSLVHVYLKFFSLGQWKFECSCLTMIVFHKVLATSFNLKHYKDDKAGKKIRPFHKDYMLEKIPSLLDWLAYCYTPYGGNSGPVRGQARIKNIGIIRQCPGFPFLRIIVSWPVVEHPVFLRAEKSKTEFHTLYL